MEIRRLITVMILAGGVGLLSPMLYERLTQPTAEELAHKEQLKVVAQEVAKARIEEKMEAYRHAVSMNNKGVACKISREMAYLSAQTGDTKLIGIVHRMQSEACGRV